MLIDTHAHLFLCKKPVSDLLEAAQAEGVSKIVNVALDIQTSRDSLALSKTYSQVIPTAGIHPAEYQRVSAF